MCVSELATRAGAQPTVHLGLEVSLLPRRLLPESLKRAEVSLRVKKSLDRHLTGRADQFVLQVFIAEEEAETLHLDPVLGGTEASSGQPAAKEFLFGRVTHPDDGQARSLATEPGEIASNGVGAADRHNHDSLGLEIAPLSTGQRLECQLIADPLDQYDGLGRLRPGQGRSRCPDRCIRTTDPAVQDFSGQSITSLTVHSTTLSRPIGRAAGTT